MIYLNIKQERRLHLTNERQRVRGAITPASSDALASATELPVVSGTVIACGVHVVCVHVSVHVGGGVRYVV